MENLANATKGLDPQTKKVAVAAFAGIAAAQAIKFAVFHALRRSAERNLNSPLDAQS